MGNQFIFGTNAPDGYIPFVWDITNEIIWYCHSSGDIQAIRATPTNIAIFAYGYNPDEMETVDNSDKIATFTSYRDAADRMVGNGQMTDKHANQAFGVINVFLECRVNQQIREETFGRYQNGHITLSELFQALCDKLGEKMVTNLN